MNAPREPEHGQDGWNLVDYDWDDETGESVTVYEKHVYGMRRETSVHREQRKWWTPPHKRSYPAEMARDDRYERE